MEAVTAFCLRDGFDPDPLLPEEVADVLAKPTRLEETLIQGFWVLANIIKGGGVSKDQFQVRSNRDATGPTTDDRSVREQSI